MVENDSNEQFCPFCRSQIDGAATICSGCGAYKAIDPSIQPLTLWLQSYALFGFALLAFTAFVAGLINDRYPAPLYGLVAAVVAGFVGWLLRRWAYSEPTWHRTRRKP